MTKIAVAILNWNGEELLKRFLKSIVENSPDDSIYLIDNASNDGSVAFVKNSFPAVNIIQLDKNNSARIYYFYSIFAWNTFSYFIESFRILQNLVFYNIDCRYLDPIVSLMLRHPDFR